jgi:hypothetical protein
VLPTASSTGILPTPIITPNGGYFSPANFPSRIYIDPNAAPPGYTITEYRLNNTGSWIPYTGPFSVAPNTTVTAVNVSNNTAIYANSSTSSQFYGYVPVPSSANWVWTMNGVAPADGANTLWFNSQFVLNNAGTTQPITIQITNATLTITTKGVTEQFKVPDSTILFDPTVTKASSTFDPVNNVWNIVLPLSAAGGSTFAAGFNIPIPDMGMQQGNTTLSWNADYSANRGQGTVSLDWTAGGTIYKSFNSNLNSDGVLLMAQPNLAAGTPVTQEGGLTAGSNGDRTQYVGNQSNTVHVAF